MFHLFSNEAIINYLLELVTLPFIYINVCSLNGVRKAAWKLSGASWLNGSMNTQWNTTSQSTEWNMITSRFNASVFSSSILFSVQHLGKSFEAHVTQNKLKTDNIYYKHLYIQQARSHTHIITLLYSQRKQPYHACSPTLQILFISSENSH